ncbi:MAG: phytanoyl-CoA dioxygenase family protein, partial [Chloroflexota bacterium]
MGSDGFEQFQQEGYWIVRGLFSPQEIEAYIAHYMALREGQEHPGDLIGAPIQPNMGESPNNDRPDPLKQYPRMTHMHRWDETSLNWLIDARLQECLMQLLGHEPYAVLTMLYFKPPGARGQALHQDNYFLKVQPGTC